MSLDILITTAGRAAIVNAQNDGTNAVTITEIGLTETAIIPTVADIALPGEFKRINAVSGQVVADDIIHISFSDESADAYSLHGFALYLDDGTLFAIYGQALPILEKTAVSIGAISIDIQFADISSDAVLFGNSEFVNPPATTEVLGVVELATVAEAQAGIDALRTLTPAAARAAILGWLLAQDGSGSGIDADMVDGIQGSQLVRNDISGTIDGQLTLTGSASLVNLRPGASDHGYISFYPSAADPLTRYASLGFGSTGTKDFSIANDYGGHIDLFTQGAGTVRINGSRIWHAANDGSGSGLDADSVDGIHASQLIRNDASGTINGRLTLTGYGDGLILKSGAADHVYIAFYPIATHQSIRTAYLGYTSAGDTTFHVGNENGGDIDMRTTGYSRVRANGNMIWHAGNDGSASGLDADLLDGQQGSYYRDLVNATGVLPNNRLSGNYDQLGDITATRLRLADAGDASESSTTHAFQIGDDNALNVIIDANEIMARDNGVGVSTYFQFGIHTATPDRIKSQNLAYFHPNNDGAGSGLDADLLDGLQGSQYLRVIAENKSNNGGYRVTSDGLAMAWGSILIPGDAQNYYIPFPAAVDFNLPPVVTSSSVRTGYGVEENPPGIQTVTATGFYVYSAANDPERMWWHAVGYR